MSTNVSTYRVSSTLLTQLSLRNINRNMQDLLTLQTQLASGLRLYKTSVDPGGAAVAMAFQQIIERRDQATTNINRSNEFLASTDNALRDLQDLLNQAVDIASTNIGTGSDDTARQNAATVVASLITQLAQIGNQQYAGRYLFAGRATQDAPFDLSSTQVRFVGDNEELYTIVDHQNSIQYNVTAEEAFGALTGSVTSLNDLNPGLTFATRLADLNGGEGVRLGTIVLNDGVTSTQVDLSGCDTIGQVISAINTNGVVSVTAGIHPSRVRLTILTDPGDTLTVTDLPGGSTAADLGILQTTPLAAGVDLVGGDLDRKLTLTTELITLRGGFGIDQGSGLRVTVGDTTEVIDFAGAVTVEDLLNRLNYSTLGLKARIDDDGRRLVIANSVASQPMYIGENEGSTAEDLGVRTMRAETLLSDLNAGQGVRIVDGVADFRIVCSNGFVVNVDLTGCATVADVLTRIAASPGALGRVSAGPKTTGNGIELMDVTGGAGDFYVERLNSSLVATDLGIEKRVSAPVTFATPIVGDDVNPVTEQGVFRHLFDLRDALLANDSAAITRAGSALREEIDRVARMRGIVGVRMQSLENSKRRIEDERLQVEGLLSDVRDLDYADALSRFTTLQATFQASLQTTGKILPLTLLDFLR